MKYDIYGIGSALLDTEVLVQPQQLAEFDTPKGSMKLVTEAELRLMLQKLRNDNCQVEKRCCGGSAANTVISVSYFGGRVFFSCCTATDDIGGLYRRDLQRAGVVSNFNQSNTKDPTGECLVLITPDAERTMHTFLGVSAEISPDDLDYDALAKSNWLYLESYLVATANGLQTAQAAFDCARKNGNQIALSFSDPGIVQNYRDKLTQLLEHPIDLLFCNGDEARNWSDTTTVEQSLSALRQVSSQQVVTLGGDGALISDSERTITVSSSPVKVIDTNGAGDMFAGAFLYAITKGHEPQQAASFATFAAGKLVSHYGPRLTDQQHRELLANHRFAAY